MDAKPVIVIGAGLAGLSAALHLQALGYPVRVIEAAPRVGGRVQTDAIDGFLLDRGFQVLLTAYPEAKAMLDYQALNLQYFDPGALLLRNGSTRKVGDPLRKPLSLFATLFSGAAGIGDMLSILKLRNQVRRVSDPARILDEADVPTSQALPGMGFGPRVIERFFTPFYRGIFLEKELHTSVAMFRFVFRMFSEGSAALPAKGMGAIPAQLADRLGRENIRTHTRVTKVEPDRVVLDDGTDLAASGVVLAVDPWSPLLGDKAQSEESAGQVTCVYFSCDRPPYRQPLIALKQAPQGLVNNIAVMNTVAPGYAPPGKHLIAVSLIGTPEAKGPVLAELIKQELLPWYGTSILSWKYLRKYRIARALPDQRSVRSMASSGDIRLREGIFLAGDHLLNGSIHAALASGRMAATAFHNSQQ